MATDDLTRPLGVDSAPRRRWRLPVAEAALGAIALLLVGAALWVMLVDDPNGGEPTAVASIDEPARIAPDAIGVMTPPPQQQQRGPVIREAPPPQNAAAAPAPATREPEGGGVVIRDPTSLQPISLASAPEPALLEPSAYGPVPRIGSDGRRPFDAYARPVGPVMPGTSRIAILVGGLGISDSGTEQALAALPGTVTLAFTPYGNDVARFVSNAREQGHEVLLQVPMEPFDYPNNDPGPQALMTDDPPAENLNRLAWAMSRFPAFAGVVSYMGGRFVAEPSALQPILQELGRRGLMYVDDGSSARSRAASAASGTLPFAAVDVVLDGTADAEAIDARLQQLEGLARERGSAIGMASAIPASIDRISAWASDAANRGIILVPVTALAHDGEATGAISDGR